MYRLGVEGTGMRFEDTDLGVEGTGLRVEGKDLSVRDFVSLISRLRVIKKKKKKVEG